MKVYVEENYEAISKRAADIIADEIRRRPDCVLGFATGSTPIGTYGRLGEMCKNGEISFKQVRTVNLDEYRGLSPNHPQSYRYFMNKNLFSVTDIPEENTNLPNGLAEDPELECKRYDKLINDLGGIDLQLLGIGHNGHIGFNEPNKHFVVGTNLIGLTKSTIEANSRFFENTEDMPTEAFTMGIGCIMSAKRILMIVEGKGKAKALYDALCGPISPECPASILRFHPNVTVIGDKEAFSVISEKEPGICV
ncbi:MAG: glucosamine-6-phosphate deaminase [Ruminococcaceae bacterium]|nr:glucosamine-6-phosphate deaminase [Oscillospiraceae bacterium]